MLDTNWNFTYYICDIDKTDNYKELVICDNGDYTLQKNHFLRFENGKLETLGYILSDFNNYHFNIKDGIISAPVTSQMVQTATINKYYKVEDSKLTECESDWYSPMETIYNNKYMSHNILQNFTSILSIKKYQLLRYLIIYF